MTGSGPDTKTIDRYMAQLEHTGKLQRLSIPVTLSTSSMAAQDLIVYVKPGANVDDALVTQVRRLSPQLHLAVPVQLSRRGTLQIMAVTPQHLVACTDAAVRAATAPRHLAEQLLS